LAKEIIILKNNKENMKNFCKNLIQKFREKLELDNPEKYVDGHYQLSSKQKICWVLGLFLVGLVVLFIKIPNPKHHNLHIVLMGCSFFSSLILITSLIYSWLCYYPSIWCFNTKEERKKITKRTIIVLYQIWTIFLMVAIFGVIFGVNYNLKYFFIMLSLIVFFNFKNHKKL